MKEKPLVVKALRELNALPHAWFEKIQQVGKRGTPDVQGCAGGRFCALEFKRDDKAHATRLQEWKLEKIREAGGYAVIVTPRSWPNVQRQIVQFVKDFAKGSSD